MTNDLIPAGTIDRREYLGSSDIAAILGLSPWRTPLDVYLEKIGEAEPLEADKQKLFARGKRMEPVILDMLADEHDEINIVARGARYRDLDYPWMAAEIDAEWMTDAGICNIEVKTVHPFAAGQFGEADTDEIPIYYAAQAMFGLMVTGRQRCLFAVLVGADNLTTYELRRDEETIAGIRAKAVAFWLDHVLARVPPEPIVLDDIYRLMRRDVAIYTEATEDIASVIRQMEQAKREAKAATEVVDEMKFRIGKWLLGEERLATPSATPKQIITINGANALTVTYQEQSRIDAASVRKAHPEIARECSRTTGFFRFDSPRQRKPI